MLAICGHKEKAHEQVKVAGLPEQFLSLFSGQSALTATSQLAMHGSWTDRLLLQQVSEAGYPLTWGRQDKLIPQVSISSNLDLTTELCNLTEPLEKEEEQTWIL